MHSYFVLALLFVMIAASDPVIFEHYEDRLIFSLNWMDSSQDLNPYIPQYHELMKSKRVKDLSLSFTYCKDPEYIITKILTQPIKVEKLSVNLDTCKVGDRGVSQLLKKIDQNQIVELQLILSSSGVTSKVGRIIGEKIGVFGKLKALRLGLMMVKIGDKGLTDLFLNPLGPNIEDLSLDLTSCKLGVQSFTNFSTFVSNIKAENLKKIDLTVRGNRLEANSTMDIAKSLKQFVYLQNFKFDAYFNSLKSKGVKPISLLLKRLQRLKLLSLDFDLNYIETQGGRMIGEALKNLTELQHLDIGVSTKNFGYNGYNHILKGIMGLTHLRYLSFRCGVNRIGTKAAKDFQELFKKIKDLQYLELYLVENLMYDEGLTILTESIATLANLKTFKINFGFNQIKKEGMKALLSMVDRQNITKLWIGLSNNPLEDAQISESIPFLENILQTCSSFQFQLLYTKISEDLMKQLSMMFKKAREEKTCNAVLYVNSEEEMKRSKAEIERQDDEDRKKNAESQQL